MAPLVQEPLLTAQDVARLAGTTRSTVYGWAERGVIPHLRLGGLIRFDPAAVMDWIEQGRQVAR